MVRQLQYEISEKDKKEAAASFLLFDMWKHDITYDVLLDGEDASLQPVLELLQTKGYIELTKNHHYKVNQQGLGKARAFEARYRTLLTYFDIFAYVDLEAGEFAWAHYYDYSSTAEWQRYLAEERWEDLRVPLIEHLGGHATELIFFHFVSEHRFDRETSGWQTELAHGVFWEQVVEICESAIQPHEFHFEDEKGAVSAESVLDDIAEQGFEWLRRLNESDQDIHANLQAWYPRHGVNDETLPPPLSGWEKPIWQNSWSLS